ncbi:hypothetical protein GLOTRDRAFT_132749 [Gloeophyllum trabeum ATCC 11539]|uniref:Uncharacterized protein n=1 Tax=Gloeophyllum trabeum (strain ATCC 11539 / FP-39264 / Madison 617) TaxID=670483 RepID=S7PX40_GLOTA|nr:uncharacterized protein GLOTRDRAFT_132749 [Gloeophyllum trabeum ATCC 11539]EPQ51942.1 hypothetical protein GLOTRDRAFT_132749 [Gloeophyllum trabeum ATCC 11539]
MPEERAPSSIKTATKKAINRPVSRRHSSRLSSGAGEVMAGQDTTTAPPPNAEFVTANELLQNQQAQREQQQADELPPSDDIGMYNTIHPTTDLHYHTEYLPVSPFRTSQLLPSEDDAYIMDMETTPTPLRVQAPTNLLDAALGPEPAPTAIITDTASEPNPHPPSTTTAEHQQAPVPNPKGKGREMQAPTGTPQQSTTGPETLATESTSAHKQPNVPRSYARIAARPPSTMPPFHLYTFAGPSGSMSRPTVGSAPSSSTTQPPLVPRGPNHNNPELHDPLLATLVNAHPPPVESAATAPPLAMQLDDDGQIQTPATNAQPPHSGAPPTFPTQALPPPAGTSTAPPVPAQQQTQPLGATAPALSATDLISAYQADLQAINDHTPGQQTPSHQSTLASFTSPPPGGFPQTYRNSHAELVRNQSPEHLREILEHPSPVLVAILHNWSGRDLESRGAEAAASICTTIVEFVQAVSHENTDDITVTTSTPADPTLDNPLAFYVLGVPLGVIPILLARYIISHPRATVQLYTIPAPEPTDSILVALDGFTSTDSAAVRLAIENLLLSEPYHWLLRSVLDRDPLATDEEMAARANNLARSVSVLRIDLHAPGNILTPRYIVLAERSPNTSRPVWYQTREMIFHQKFPTARLGTGHARLRDGMDPPTRAPGSPKTNPTQLTSPSVRGVEAVAEAAAMVAAVAADGAGVDAVECLAQVPRLHRRRRHPASQAFNSLMHSKTRSQYPRSTTLIVHSRPTI